MPTRICVIPECGNELSEGSRLDTCPTCRSSMGMWKRRGIPAILQRRARLKKYDSRMELLADKNDKKVVVLKQRRKRA
jgi:Zn-finger nucleic acid-binding protein